MPYEPPVYHLWPDNEEPWLVFISLRSQWRIGTGGATGLDYAAVLTHLREGLRLSRRRINALYPLLLAAEDGALEGWAQKRKDEDR